MYDVEYSSLQVQIEFVPQSQSEETRQYVRVDLPDQLYQLSPKMSDYYIEVWNFDSVACWC